jgi:ribosomal protein S18 acetylase RimI-like enzyme
MKRKIKTEKSIRQINEKLSLNFYPLTPDKWNDLVKLFGENGACGGCWCMWWRLSRSEFNKKKGKGNKNSFNKIVRSKTVPGILAYDNNEPVGWIAVEPRDNYPTLKRSRVLANVDEKRVWSVTCFYIKRNYRRRGVSVQLINAAKKHVKQRGGKILEGYPTDIPKEWPAAFVYTGLFPAFLEAGFKEVLRRSERRPIVRCTIK